MCPPSSERQSCPSSVSCPLPGDPVARFEHGVDPVRVRRARPPRQPSRPASRAVRCRWRGHSASSTCRRRHARRAGRRRARRRSVPKCGFRVAKCPRRAPAGWTDPWRCPSSRIVVDEEDVLPGSAAVHGAEDPPLRLRPVGMPQRAHENNVRIGRVNDQARDAAGLPPAP